MKVKFASLMQEGGKCEEEWKEFRNSMQECAKSVCGVRRVGGALSGGMKMFKAWWRERREHMEYGCKWGQRRREGTIRTAVD